MSSNILVVRKEKQMNSNEFSLIDRHFQVQKRFLISLTSFRCGVVHCSTFSTWFFHVFSSQWSLFLDFVFHRIAVSFNRIKNRIQTSFDSFLGEKVSIGVTTLLSMTVFLMLVTDSMPPNSDSLPLIGEFLFVKLWRVVARWEISELKMDVNAELENRGNPQQSEMSENVTRTRSILTSIHRTEKRNSFIWEIIDFNGGNSSWSLVKNKV